MTTTIVEPAADAFWLPPLVSIPEFVEWTDGRVSYTDKRVRPLLDGASAGIRRFCGWHIAPVLEQTLVLDGSGSRLLVVPTMRLSAVLALSNEGTAVDDLTTVDFSEHGMVTWRGGRFTDRYGQVTARIRHGFDLAEVADVAQIVKQVTANALSSPMGATQEQAGALSVSWATTAPGVSGGLSLLERDLAVLAQYRLSGRA